MLDDSLMCFFPTGQMIWMTSISHMIFIGSPRLSSLNEMMERKMYLSDIPLYDVTRELVLLNQQRIAEIEVRYVSLCMVSLNQQRIAEIEVRYVPGSSCCLPELALGRPRITGSLCPIVCVCLCTCLC